MPSVIAKFGSDTTAFKGGLDEMRNSTQKWTGDIKGMIAGAFAAGTVISFLSNMRQEIARVVDLAQRFDTSAESIQRVGNAAKLAGSDIEAVAKQMTRLTIEAANSGDKLEALGINAEEFVNADMEGKLLMLAGAYESAGNNQERMVLLMELLGNRGQDILPLLAQGVAELKKQLFGVAVVGEAAAQSIAQFDDAMDVSTMHIQSWIGSLIEAFQAGITVITAFATVFNGPAMAKLYLTGNVKGMLDEVKRVFKEGNELADLAWKDRNDEFKQRRSSKTPFDEEKFSALMKSAGQSGKSDEQKAQEKFDEVTKRIAFERLDAEQKIKALQVEIAREAQRFMKAGVADSATKLEAMTRIKELEEQIGREKADIAKAEAKAAEDIAKAQQDKADAVAKSAAALKTEEDRQALQAMSLAAQAAELRKRQAALYAESKRAAESGDSVRANEVRLDALRMNDDITRADKAAAPSALSTTSSTAGRTSIVSSSLASIGGGGGGGVFISGADPQVSELRTHTSLLQQLVALQRQGNDNPQAPYQL